MTIASTRLYAALSALFFPCFTGSDARASDRIETVASVTITRSAAVTVVNNTPLQTLLLTTAIAPASVVFTASSSGPVTVSTASGGSAGVGSAGGSTTGAGGIDAGGQGPSAGDGGGGALIAFGGSVSGTTINGDAVSVSVGSVSGGSAAGSGRVPMVIAQYN